MKKTYTKPEIAKRDTLASIAALNCSGPEPEKGCFDQN